MGAGVGDDEGQRHALAQSAQPVGGELFQAGLPGEIERGGDAGRGRQGGHRLACMARQLVARGRHVAAIGLQDAVAQGTGAFGVAVRPQRLRAARDGHQQCGLRRFELARRLAKPGQ